LKKEKYQKKFKANAKLRRFAIPRLPKYNGARFCLLPCCVIRWLQLCSGFSADVLAQFNWAYRCEIWCSKGIVNNLLYNPKPDKPEPKREKSVTFHCYGTAY